MAEKEKKPSDQPEGPKETPEARESSLSSPDTSQQAPAVKKREPLKVKPGTIVGDRYKVIKSIESGGMGTVYKAVHVGLERKVALKILNPTLTENKRLVSRFVQEAKMIAMLHHRNIVDVLDVGYTQEGTPFFVMEFLHGESLKDIMRRRSRLMSVGEVMSIMKDVLSGLSFAHRKGIIHRDMKPGNIFLASETDGTKLSKILDFGISKLLSPERKQEGGKESTLVGAFLGTPAYMSPEQARGRFDEVDTRSDIYSCGVIMYKMLTGMTPFKGDSFVEVMANVIHAPVPPPSFIRETLPGSVDALIMKAMSRNPDERFQDCRAFIRMIEEIEAASEEKSYDMEEGDVAYPMDFAGSEQTPIQEATTVSGQEVRAIAEGLEGEGKKDLGWSFTGKRKTPIHIMEKRLARRKKLLRFAPVAVAVVLIPAAALVIRWQLSTWHRGKAAVERAVPVGPDTAAMRQPATVKLTLTGFPEKAEIAIDGKKRNESPIILERGSQQVTAVVTMEGREILRRTFVPERDIELLYSAPGEEAAEQARKTETSKKEPGKKKKEKKKSIIIKTPLF